MSASRWTPPRLRWGQLAVPTVALLVAGLLVGGAITAVIRSGGTPAVGGRGDEANRPETGPVGGLAPSPAELDQDRSPGVGDDALVDVAVATLWVEPAVTRPVDEPSTTNPVDIHRWLSAMTDADRLWLVGRLATQALYGQRVRVLETRGTWSRVALTGQPSSLHPDGYPGWLPTGQLRSGSGVDTGRSAVVVTPLSELRDATDPGRPVMELAYATRLPVLAVDGRWVTVATPAATPGLLAGDDVEVSDSLPGATSGSDLVRSALLFSGVPYLWAGTSALGFDCSGLTWAVYGAHGIVIPRDADEQAGAGWAVSPAQLEPGDLLFYASGPGRDTIHHVAMYVGDGRMIQSPATGRTVETVPVEAPAYARQFWGARRYLRP